jgi:hypothetical protein
MTKMKSEFEPFCDWANIILANLSHASGDFGLAVVLQQYLGDTPFLPVVVGWLLLGFCLAMHVYAWSKGGVQLHQPARSL